MEMEVRVKGKGEEQKKCEESRGKTFPVSWYISRSTARQQ